MIVAQRSEHENSTFLPLCLAQSPWMPAVSRRARAPAPPTTLNMYGLGFVMECSGMPGDVCSRTPGECRGLRMRPSRRRRLHTCSRCRRTCSRCRRTCLHCPQVKRATASSGLATQQLALQQCSCLNTAGLASSGVGKSGRRELFLGFPS